MIRYALVCEAGHEFEGWFAGSSGFAEQQKAGQLSCAVCGSSHVAKALMAPSLGSRVGDPRSDAAAGERQEGVGSAHGTEPAHAAPGESGTVRLAAHTDKREELVGLLRKLRRHVTENAEYVGKRFPEEARKIHYGETDKRGIYGEASPQEAEALAEEGVEFHPLPVLPEERN